MEKLNGVMENLKKENDSLKNIVEEINDKYVFDSITIRNIPHYENTNKLHSVFKTEIVFVGYNGNGNTSVIIKDSVTKTSGVKTFKIDTLNLLKGGFWLERKLDSEINYFQGSLKTENKYGKSYEVPFATAIGISKD
ncbi:hypothetical protein [Flagellimonas sp.]|uniref:hypothetical protein n=1 Tax=Flagellimonas sp. TaxID=2058762 RepID=UPI003B5A98A1